MLLTSNLLTNLAQCTLIVMSRVHALVIATLVVDVGVIRIHHLPSEIPGQPGSRQSLSQPGDMGDLLDRTLLAASDFEANFPAAVAGLLVDLLPELFSDDLFSVRDGKAFVKVSRWFPSSKVCSECGYQMGKMSLDIRSWVCPSCLTHHDRDINAARNIRDEGLRILASGIGATASGGNVRRKLGCKSSANADAVEAGSSLL
jgi:hypothetical protein